MKVPPHEDTVGNPESRLYWHKPLLLLLSTTREYWCYRGTLSFHRMNSERRGVQKLTQKMYNSGQFGQHWSYDLCFACLRLASFRFSQFSTSNFSLFLPALACCFLRKRFQLSPTRRVHFWFTFFLSLSLSLVQVASGGYAMCTGKCRLYFAQTIHKTSWNFFQQRKKKPRGCLLVSIF